MAAQRSPASLAVAIGLELPKTNPLAAIHVTLKRLCEASEVIKSRDTKGQKRYRWTGKNITVHVPTGTITLTGVSGAMAFDPATSRDLGFMTGGTGDGVRSAVQANYAHRQRAHTAAIQASTQGSYNSALHIETDKKK